MVLAGMAFFATSVLLICGWSMSVGGPLTSEGTGVLRLMGTLGFKLGYWIYMTLESTSGLLGFTRSYEILLGWPLIASLIAFPVFVGAMVWLLAAAMVKIANPSRDESSHDAG